VEDVSGEQGGTVFVPGTHMHPGAEMRQAGATYAMMELFRRRANIGVLCHNLAKLWHMHRRGAPALAPGELRERVFSTRWDQHQPNLLRFLLGKNAEFSLAMLGPRTLWRLYRHRAELKRLFRLVQSAPRKGTVILYRSDMIHAGPDNRSPRPRRLFGMSIARDIIEPKYWHDGYSPHPSLIAAPLRFGDLLETAPLTLAPPAPPARAATR
jgi:ectoine hydroxylase-related dioxygenase (phytanoyl-CoA dioxygenase family)